MRKYITGVVICLFLALTPAYSDPLVKGADVGWLPQMEASNYKFYDAQGVQKDCLQILKENGINTIRLRVFVHPSLDKKNGHCGKDEVVAMAVRAQKMGFRVMIDFHYSDTFAGWVTQKKPIAWDNHSFGQLLNDVYDHTTDVLTALKTNGITPEWVQIGNEMSTGLLWPEGNTYHWDQLAQLVNKGYDAVKAIDSQTKVVIHLETGGNNEKFRNFFDNLKNHGGKWDVIGMSFYPDWKFNVYGETIDKLGLNLTDMASRYGKEVMVVEVGGEVNKPQRTYEMLLAVQKKVKEVPNGMGIGVIYWEPEGEASWSGYGFSCWGKDGKPTKALTAFAQKIL